jgi:hypothetical protein
LGWVKYTKKGVVCQEEKTTEEKTTRYGVLSSGILGRLGQRAFAVR